MSLISRLKAVVAGEDYLDDDFDELDYATEDELNSLHLQKQNNRLDWSRKRSKHNFLERY